MILIWGTTRYGRTDEVPSLFYVVTQFGHLWFLPLFPLGSYLLLEGHNDAEGNPKGIQIPFSCKSFLLGWLRAATLLGAIILGIAGFAERKGPSGSTLMIAAASLAACLWLTYSKTCRRASYTRAVELGRFLGMNRKGMILLDLQFGRLNEEQAAELAEKAEEADLAEEQRRVESRDHQLRQYQDRRDKHLRSTSLPARIGNAPRGGRSPAHLQYEFRVTRMEGYLHVRLFGDNHRETIAKCLQQVHKVCQNTQCPNVLVEQNLEGAGMEMGEIFGIVEEASTIVWPVIRKIAFVDVNPRHDLQGMTFKETTAVNQGVNVHIFATLQDGQNWLVQQLNPRQEKL